MSLPSGLIFFLDFEFSGELGESGSQDSRFGNVKEKSIYGTDQVAKGIVDGVDLVDARGGDLGGPRTVGGNGYSYSSPSGSNAAITTGTGQLAVKDVFTLDGSVSQARRKLIDYDPDLLAKTDSTLSVVIVDIRKDAFDQADYENMAGFSFRGIAAGAAGTNDILATLNAISGISFTGYTTTSRS